MLLFQRNNSRFVQIFDSDRDDSIFIFDYAFIEVDNLDTQGRSLAIWISDEFDSYCDLFDAYNAWIHLGVAEGEVDLLLKKLVSVSKEP